MSKPDFARAQHLLGPVVLVVGLIVGAVGITAGVQHALSAYLLDVGVFRDAGQAFIDGENLYVDFDTRSGFRFIYPPFAALLFAPLTWVGEQTMEVLWTLASVAALFGIIAMAVRWLQRSGLGLPGPMDNRYFWAWSIGLTGLATCFEPVRAHLNYGQINVFLILLVAADVFGFTPRRVRGLGIGIAAGIKITPAAYALIFLVRKDFASVARSAGFFLLTAVIGWILRPEASRYFWTTEFVNEERGGAPPYPPNQSLTGLIARLGVDGDTALAIMKPGFVIIAALSLWGAWRFERTGRRVHALILVILGVCLAGPLAVTHHWIGIVLVFPLVFCTRSQAVRIAALLVIVANYLGLHDLYPDQETYAFEPGLWLLGNSQGWTGLILFCVLLIHAWKAKPVGGVGYAASHEENKPSPAVEEAR